MHHSLLLRFTTIAALVAGLLIWPAVSSAQEVSGQAKAIQATVLGVTSTLADTGTLSGSEDAREASSLTGTVPALGGAEVLHAATVSSIYGWDALDYVASEASLGNLGLNVGGNSIRADFVMAEAMAPVSGANAGTTSIDSLSINGLPVDVTGAVNQTIALIGGRIVINEQQTSATGSLLVNALHIIVDGVADVVIGSATAGVSQAASTSSLF